MTGSSIYRERDNLYRPCLRWLCAAAALFWLAGFAQAIDPTRTSSQYLRQRWGPDEGFPHGPVYAIAQTADGYLWMGTESGLYSFDGVAFRATQNENAARSELNHVLGLFAGRDGSLWVQLRRPAFLRYRDGVFTYIMETLGRPRASVTTLGRSYDGSLLMWALDGEGFAFTVRGERLQTLSAPENFSRSPVLAVAQTKDGAVWVGTRDTGLFRIRNGVVSPIAGLPDPKVNVLVPANGNALWIGTDAGVVRWNGSNLQAIPALSGIQALSMTLDRDDNLWIGTNRRGLLRFNANGVSLLDQPGPHIHDVTAVFEDREGNVWSGRDSTLERLRDSPFLSYAAAEGLPAEQSNAVLVDGQGRVWFTPPQGGLWWFRNEERGHIAALNHDVVYSLAGGSRTLWAGTQNSGLVALDISGPIVKTKTYTRENGLPQNSIYSLWETRDGSVWAGTLSGGAARLQGGRFTAYSIADGLVSNTVASILQSSDGTVWFATPQGVTAKSGEHWLTYRRAQGLPADDVTCLLEDRRGTLWAGTHAGLAAFDGARFYVPSNLPPLLRGPVLGMAEDLDKSLWVTTAEHVVRVNLDKLRQGTLADDDLRSFGTADGLRGSEGVKRQRSVFAENSGRIWFALSRGISVVDPRRVTSSAASAIPHVQTVTADGRPLPLARLVAPPGSKRVVFTFTGLSLSVPDRVRFRYLLENFDSGWSAPNSDREAVYTNLPPGAYRFRLMASNPDGVWSPSEAVISFQLKPLVWQTPWFRLLVFLVLAGAVVVIYRLRLRTVTHALNVRFEERLGERTRIARELHDTLLQGFLSASMQVHVASDLLPDASPVKPTLRRALQLMSQVIEEGRNAVRGLRSSQTESLDLELAFSAIEQEFAGQRQQGEEVSYRVIVEGLRRPLRPVLRDEIYRIGREAVINSFRHSGAAAIDVKLSYYRSQLHLSIRDNGRGIDAKTLVSGVDGHWGLSGMRERSERIGARLHLWSNAGAGTEVALSVPGRIAFLNSRNTVLKRFGARAAERDALKKEART